MAPGRRKQHNTQAGKLIRPSQLSSGNTTNNASTSSAPLMSSQQNNSNKYSPLVSHSLQPQQSVQKNPGICTIFFVFLKKYKIIIIFPAQFNLLQLLPNKRLCIEYTINHLCSSRFVFIFTEYNIIWFIRRNCGITFLHLDSNIAQTKW